MDNRRQDKESTETETIKSQLQGDLDIFLNRMKELVEIQPDEMRTHLIESFGLIARYTPKVPYRVDRERYEIAIYWDRLLRSIKQSLQNLINVSDIRADGAFISASVEDIVHLCESLSTAISHNEIPDFVFNLTKEVEA